MDAALSPVKAQRPRGPVATHSHYDFVLDAAYTVQRTHSYLYGSVLPAYLISLSRVTALHRAPARWELWFESRGAATEYRPETVQAVGLGSGLEIDLNK